MTRRIARLRWRVNRLRHWRWYRSERRAGRVYLFAGSTPITPIARPDRSDELRSAPLGSNHLHVGGRDAGTPPDRPLSVTFSGSGTVRASGVVSTADTVASGCADVEITGLDHRPRNG